MKHTNITNDHTLSAKDQESILESARETAKHLPESEKFPVVIGEGNLACIVNKDGGDFTYEVVRTNPWDRKITKAGGIKYMVAGVSNEELANMPPEQREVLDDLVAKSKKP